MEVRNNEKSIHGSNLILWYNLDYVNDKKRGPLSPL